MKESYLSDYSEQVALVSRGEHEDEEEGMVLRNSSREDIRTSTDDRRPWKIRENGHGHSKGYEVVGEEEA